MLDVLFVADWLVLVIRSLEGQWLRQCSDVESWLCSMGYLLA